MHALVLTTTKLHTHSKDMMGIQNSQMHHNVTLTWAIYGVVCHPFPLPITYVCAGTRRNIHPLTPILIIKQGAYVSCWHYWLHSCSTFINDNDHMHIFIA